MDINFFHSFIFNMHQNFPYSTKNSLLVCDVYTPATHVRTDKFKAVRKYIV
jgi:hypothetical protein